MFQMLKRPEALPSYAICFPSGLHAAEKMRVVWNRSSTFTGFACAFCCDDTLFGSVTVRSLGPSAHRLTPTSINAAHIIRFINPPYEGQHSSPHNRACDL